MVVPSTHEDARTFYNKQQPPLRAQFLPLNHILFYLSQLPTPSSQAPSKRTIKFEKPKLSAESHERMTPDLHNTVDFHSDIITSIPTLPSTLAPSTNHHHRRLSDRNTSAPTASQPPSYINTLCPSFSSAHTHDIKRKTCPPSAPFPLRNPNPPLLPPPLLLLLLLHPSSAAHTPPPQQPTPAPPPLPPLPQP